MSTLPNASSPGLRTRIPSFVSRHPAVTSFLLAFAAFLAVALVLGAKFFYYDAGGYWVLAGSFSKNGHFSLLNFENAGLRGYALPLLIYTVRRIAEPFTIDPFPIVAVFNAVLFALIGAVLAPRLAEIAWPERLWNVPRRIALCVLILVFWNGWLSYPLSDFPALAVALLALIALSAFDSPLAMLGAGVAAGVALNMRPAYILLIPLMLAIVAGEWYLQRRAAAVARWSRRALCLALFFAGVLVACLPQSLSQHDKFDSYNPIPGGSDLAGLQYTGGLQLQLYGTYVGNGLLTPRMEYRDPSAASILAEVPDETVSGTGEYVGIVLRHPLTMSGVFLRHVVNGLDQRYTGPLVENINFSGQRALRFLGFLLIFGALLRLAWPQARRRLGTARWRYPAVLLLACGSSIPSAMEVRFLLPVFVLSGMLVLAAGWPSPLGPRRDGARRYLPVGLILLSAAAYFVVVWTIVSGASENLHIV